MRHKFSLRHGRDEDTNRLSVLATQVWLHTYVDQGVNDLVADYVLNELSPQRCRQRLHDPNSQFFLAEREHGLLGFAVARTSSPCPAHRLPTVELQTLYVQEHHFGSGIGTSLLKAAEAYALERSGRGLWLKVNAKNERAIAFYRRHDYVKVGTTHFVIGQESHENHVLVAASDA